VSYIVQQLIDRRKALGLSQREVGRRIGSISTSTVCTIERGEHLPRLDTLTSWAAALGLEVQLVEQSGGNR
jgi:transcriptional regulator with XRE-family HTH domain